jgi:hypothetical protein
MKVRPAEAELSQADKQTGLANMTKLPGILQTHLKGRVLILTLEIGPSHDWLT